MPELRRSNRVASQGSQVSYASESDDEPPKKKTKPQPAKKVEESDSLSEGLEIGQLIPDITLKDEDDKDINLLHSSKDSTYLILFAYPKASTPGCTRQVNGFEKNYQYYQTNNIQIFGISADSPENQKKFKQKFGLTYKLVSDPNRELIEALGAKKSPTGIKRSHWIFKNGKLLVKKLQISPEVSIASSLEDIESFLNENEEEDDEGEEGEAEEGEGEEKEEEEDVKEDVKEEVAEESKGVESKEQEDDSAKVTKTDAKPDAE